VLLSALDQLHHGSGFGVDLRTYNWQLLSRHWTKRDGLLYGGDDMCWRLVRDWHRNHGWDNLLHVRGPVLHVLIERNLLCGTFVCLACSPLRPRGRYDDITMLGYHLCHVHCIGQLLLAFGHNQELWSRSKHLQRLHPLQRHLLLRRNTIRTAQQRWQNLHVGSGVSLHLQLQPHHQRGFRVCDNLCRFHRPRPRC